MPIQVSFISSKNGLKKIKIWLKHIYSLPAKKQNKKHHSCVVLDVLAGPLSLCMVISFWLWFRLITEWSGSTGSIPHSHSVSILVLFVQYKHFAWLYIINWCSMAAWTFADSVLGWILKPAHTDLRDTQPCWTVKRQMKEVTAKIYSR